MKKVILFSPKGYVGGYIKERLQSEKNVQLFEMTRESDLSKYDKGYDVIIYSAAITSSRNETADKYVQDNVVTAVSIINFCKVHDVKRIVFLSSDEIYGELNRDTVTDKAIMVNPNLYAATKYLAEKIIMESGIPYFILRLPGIVGRDWGKNFIYKLLTKAKRNERIEIYNMNKPFNNILYIDDLTKFIATLCNYDTTDKNEIFLLGNIERIPLKEIVSHIMSLYRSTSEVVNLETDKRRYFTLDVTRAVEYGYSSIDITTIIDKLYQIKEGEM